MKLWLITVFIIVIIIIILVVFVLIYSAKKNAPPGTPTEALWSNPQAGPNSNKNTCQLYTFPVNKTKVNGVETYISGNPTFNTNILNNLTGDTNLNVGCLDTDQIIARQVNHSCQNDNGCYGLSGVVIPEGQSDTFYSADPIFNAEGINLGGCIPGGGGGTGGISNIGSNPGGICVGQLSVISIGFDNELPPSGNFCITVLPGFQNVALEQCDPTQENQLFRITRTFPNTAPSQNTQTGSLAQIYERESGLCLNGLTLGTCSTKGEDWLLLPPLPYCVNNDIPPDCSIDALIPSLCNGTGTLISVQQIVYVGNIDLSNMPKNANCLLYWLSVTQSAQALYRNGVNLELRPVNIDNTQSGSENYVSQYLNITTFNLLSQQKVCTNLNEIVTCLGF